jgi:hypothetical protein
MSMFNWAPDSGVASRYLWVYFVVSIPLTITVIVICRVWWIMEDKKYQVDLAKTRKEKAMKLSQGNEFSADDDPAAVHTLMNEYREEVIEGITRHGRSQVSSRYDHAGSDAGSH